MSLDIDLVCKECGVSMYSGNYTHNIGKIAKAIGVYESLWHPDRAGIMIAEDLIPPLMCGMARMLSEWGELEKMEPPNGWGDIKSFYAFLERLLTACIEHKRAHVKASI